MTTTTTLNELKQRGRAMAALKRHNLGSLWHLSKAPLEGRRDVYRVRCRRRSCYASVIILGSLQDQLPDVGGTATTHACPLRNPLPPQMGKRKETL